MTMLGPASGTQPPDFDENAAGSRAGQILSEGSPGPSLSLEQRRAEARLWFDEFADFSQAGRLRLAMREAGGEWSELRGFRPGCGPYRDADREALLGSLAASVVNLSDRRADVFCCPYPHAGSRSKRGATARRHVHADVDGPLNMAAVRGLGAMAVASGSLAEDGSPRGHAYLRLSESVDPETHSALCRGLGRVVGGEHADQSKVSDEDVLRPAGALNWKGAVLALVHWLVPPDDPGVRTWEPAELARALRVGWPVAPARLSTSEAIELLEDDEQDTLVAPTSAGKREAEAGRLEGLLRAVRDAPRGEGNSCMNWAAGKAAAHGAPEAFRSELVTAFLSRPVPVGESLGSRRAEAERTVASGWRWGLSHPDEASAEGAAGRSRGGSLETAVSSEASQTQPLAPLVQERLRRLRADHEAHRLLREEEAATEAASRPPFDYGTLAEVLARPAEPPHRVEGLVLADALTLVVAQRKTGKTTMVLNLARALLTGEPFLGRFPTLRLRRGERVALLNYEVSAGLIAGWGRSVGVPGDGLVLVNVRGRRNPLGHEGDRAELAEYLRGMQVRTLIVDPFSRAFSGDNSNDAGQVTAWLASLDRWARGEVGATDVVLTAHAGWEGERARNSSALEDAPDSILTLTRGRSAGDTGRYLKALGRGVELEEDRLDFDPVRLRLSMSGQGSRQQTGHSLAVERLVPEVVDFVTRHPGCSQRNVSDTKRGGVQGRAELVREALRTAVDRGFMTTSPGPRGTILYSPTEAETAVRPTASQRVPDSVSDCVRASYRDADALSQPADPVRVRDADTVSVTDPTNPREEQGSAPAPSDAAPASSPLSPRTRATPHSHDEPATHGEDRT